MAFSDQLFRREAVEANHTQWLGDVYVVSPSSLNITAAAAIIFSICIAACLVLIPFEVHSKAHGVLVAMNAAKDVQDLRSNDALTIKQVVAQLDHRYHADDVLAWASDADSDLIAIRIPMDSRLVDLDVFEGKRISKGQLIARLAINARDYYAELTLPQSELNLVDARRSLLITIPSLEHFGPFHGRVSHIENVASGEWAQDPRVKLSIEFDSVEELASLPIRSGTAVTVDLHTEQISIFNLIMHPGSRSGS